ncbi:hypothetical protein C482_04314 [Natrialba chahannaoensis JCM 10990]|uniref:Peptidase M50 n=1 Tax=Natrialba chahannaoensis JCM 10990 TaxID=1227492 RepID=M0AXH9_9EURY|nr:hypothetical protein [Natrialba chahannaoensis]ELZ03215.1 hypothetical protein C482_04314 [Natrialba chahannaoensis JCM 10990]
MLALLWNFLGVVVVVLGITFIHELGHYLTGRWVVGIPAAEIKLVMAEFPPHAALWDNGEWVGPDEFERYSERYEEHDPDYTHLELYIGAGELVQTLGVVTIAAIFAGLGLHSMAVSIVLISLLMTGLYLAWDVLLSLYSGHPVGDYSALWLATPLAAVGVVLGFLIPHVLIYLWL